MAVHNLFLQKKNSLAKVMSCFSQIIRLKQPSFNKIRSTFTWNLSTVALIKFFITIFIISLHFIWSSQFVNKQNSRRGSSPFTIGWSWRDTRPLWANIMGCSAGKHMTTSPEVSSSSHSTKENGCTVHTPGKSDSCQVVKSTAGCWQCDILGIIIVIHDVLIRYGELLLTKTSPSQA